MAHNGNAQGHLGFLLGQSELSLAASLGISGFQDLGTLYWDATGGKNTEGGAARDTPL
jgi:hypothetical protein